MPEALNNPTGIILGPRADNCGNPEDLVIMMKTSTMAVVIET